MKRISMSLAAAMLITASGGAALAADIPVIVPPAPPPVYVPPPAERAGGPYVSVFGGLIWVPPVFVDAELDGAPFLISSDRGYRFGGALGYKLNDMIGAEAEVSWARVRLAGLTSAEQPDLVALFPPEYNATATLLTVMGNLVLGRTFGRLTPYVAVGAGAASVTLNVPPDGPFGPDGVFDKDWTWGAQAFAGVNFAITENISIGGRYRFQVIGPTNFIDEGDDPVFIDRFINHGAELVVTLGF